MKSFTIIVFMLCAIIMSGCSNKTPKEVEKVIRKAGTNSKELKKVIAHYKTTGERKKLKAAYFLIANMEGKYSITGEGLDAYYNLLKEIDQIKKSGIKRDSLDKIIKVKIDSLEAASGQLDYSKLTRISDLTVITSGFLIKNIDHAFMVWEKPWAKHLNFDAFCEFILPYRIHNEPLSNWREYFYNQLISFQDSIKDKTDPKELVTKISFFLYRKWTHLDNFTSYNFYPDPVEMSKCNGGLCDHRYFLITSMFRSIGLPVSIESTPQWTNYTGGHAWNVMIDKDGRCRPFNGGEDNMRFYEKNLIPMGDGGSICTKVYRRTFALQKESLPFIVSYTNLPKLFNDRHLVDVTDNYDFPAMEYVLEFDDDKLDGKIVYLCNFNYGYDINHVAWAKVNKRKANFGYIGLPAFYMPVTIGANNQLSMVHKPLVHYKEKEKRHEYDPDLTKKGTVRVYRKFGFSGDFISNAKGMIGAKFQGSNKPDFSDAVDLYTISTQAKAYEEAEIRETRKFRYFRYLSADSADVRVAELEFWAKGPNNTEVKLEGKIVGSVSDNGGDNDAIYKNAFDEDIETNFNAKAGSWVGIDLCENNQVPLARIWYLPRNNQNEIAKENVYELFYLADRWISLGRKVADKHYLVFENAPTEALFLLKNLTEGKQERIFMYDVEKQEQVFW